MLKVCFLKMYFSSTNRCPSLRGIGKLPPLAFVVQSVFEIHCLIEGPYRSLYVWGTEIVKSKTLLNTIIAQ